MLHRVFRRAIHYGHWKNAYGRVSSSDMDLAMVRLQQRCAAQQRIEAVQKASPSGLGGTSETGFHALVDSPPNTKFVIPGNTAFALGVMHAGFHAADGYPGTPSTEVIDRCLLKTRDRISVGWSVNEATAAGVGLGRSMAGEDCVVTMKIPGVFQAADVLASSAFFDSSRGALVYYVVSDYIPSSTQHVVDPRFFFRSIKLPVIEPSTHQCMYEFPRIAADISRTYKTPVVIFAADTLAHAEGLMQTGTTRAIQMREPTDLSHWKSVPSIVRQNYRTVIEERMPAVQDFYENSELVTEFHGEADWGIIVNGNGYNALREVLSGLSIRPSVLVVSGIYPVPHKRIRDFAEKFPEGKLAVIEDGDRFLTGQIELLLHRRLISKKPETPEIFLTPTSVMELLAANKLITKDPRIIPVPKLPDPIPRPPTNCPGCPYIVLEHSLKRMKGYGGIGAVFGDIGCSSLLPSLDTIIAMGVSDHIRQGFVLSDPIQAARYVSVIGDSAEAHTGLNATRNAIFKGTPGVKIVLNNEIIGMTGGQLCPTAGVNMQDQPNKFNLEEVLRAEGAYVISEDGYRVKEVYRALLKVLDAARDGLFSVLILNGACLGIVDEEYKRSDVTVNKQRCAHCHNCEVCSGITYDEDGASVITPQCNNCGGAELPVCGQLCPFECSMESSSETQPSVSKKMATVGLFAHQQYVREEIAQSDLPKSIRLAIRGIGGQGNLFFGRALTEIFSKTPIIETNIIKGDTHGMSQLGGPVLSTFSCGDVGSTVLQSGTADVIVAMELSELLRPGFLELLKPGGTILINDYARVPGSFKGDYPSLSTFESRLQDYKIVKVDASRISRTVLGDRSEKTANVIMLGALSTIPPFSSIPYANWIDALRGLSKSETVLQSNCAAFQTGVDVVKGNFVDDSDVQEVTEQSSQERAPVLSSLPWRTMDLSGTNQSAAQVLSDIRQNYLNELKARYAHIGDAQAASGSAEDSAAEVLMESSEGSQIRSGAGMK